MWFSHGDGVSFCVQANNAGSCAYFCHYEHNGSRKPRGQNLFSARAAFSLPVLFPRIIFRARSPSASVSAQFEKRTHDPPAETRAEVPAERLPEFTEHRFTDILSDFASKRSRDAAADRFRGLFVGPAPRLLFLFLFLLSGSGCSLFLLGPLRLFLFFLPKSSLFSEISVSIQYPHIRSMGQSFTMSLLQRQMRLFIQRVSYS